MYLLRNALRSDLQDLKVLARMLDTVNLPDDERELAAILHESGRSFDGRIRDPLRRRYVFALEDLRRRRVVGTSMIIAQHGTRESPCTFFDVSEREHYSSSLDRWFKHQVLSIGYHFDGPTEIGGLVVHPRERGGQAQPGKQLSFVRFLYVAMHRERFRERMLAELMPPLSPDGKSLFWESCGRRFTGLDYQEADKLSRRNKEFIQQLFPPGDLYTTVFPPRVQRFLGAVGPATEAARRILERVGFRYVKRIDPFDGGPHYECPTGEVALVRDCRRLTVAGAEPPRGAPWMLVGTTSRSGRVRFRAVRAEGLVEGGALQLHGEARRLLRVRPGDRVHAIPFP